MGAPRYLKVCLMSMICSVAVLAATNSEPYIAVSTVACFLEYQSTGVIQFPPEMDENWLRYELLN